MASGNNWKIGEQCEHKQTGKMGHVRATHEDMVMVKWYGRGRGKTLVHHSLLQRTDSVQKK
jgi:hypothetical protein